jgi:hypothetical protein
LRDKTKKKRPFRGFIFFDLESYINEVTGNHVVNLAMAQRVCLKCMDLKTRCEICQEVIKYYNISDFTDFVLDVKNHHFIFISHNGKLLFY